MRDLDQSDVEADAERVQDEADAHELEQARSELFQSMPDSVRAYCHKRALQVAYGGNEELYQEDCKLNDDSRPWENLTACRQYLYHEAYTNVFAEVAA